MVSGPIAKALPYPYRDPYAGRPGFFFVVVFLSVPGYFPWAIETFFVTSSLFSNELYLSFPSLIYLLCKMKAMLDRGSGYRGYQKDLLM